MLKKTGFVIIGSGSISDIHAQAIRDIPEAELIGVFDINKENAARFAKKYGIINYDSLQGVYDDDRVDAVNICTPSGLHAKIATEALRAGKNAVVEKPMALTAEDCDKIIEAEKRSGKMCAVISQLRYADGVMAVKKAISEGSLGKPVMGSVYMKYYRSPEYYSSSAWRGTWEMDGGGALMNQGIHGIDLLLHFMGNVKSIKAAAKTLVHNIETEDTAAAVLEFENGAVGVIEGTTSVNPGYPRIIQLCGSAGSITLEENNIKKWDIDKERPDTSDIAVAAHSNPTDISYLGHKRQLQNIVNAINKKEPLEYTGAQARETVRLICGIYQSAKTDKTIILNGSK
jgi:predicted dehydrogenase